MADPKWTVIITEPMDKTGQSHRLLEENGCKVILGRTIWEHPDWPYTEDELIELCGNADAAIVSTRDLFTSRFMESLNRLRAVCKYGIGVERIDVQAATDLGIMVTHTPVPENVTCMSEGTIALMLALLKKIKFADKFMKEGGWRGTEVFETVMLRGKTLGLIGLGRIGRAVAEKLQAWGVNILAYDPYVSQEHAGGLAQLVGMDELLSRSDVVSLHVVITPETKGMIGERELSLMKRSAYLVNTSRGDAIQEQALIRALREGLIAGAALDVFEKEPPGVENPLLHMENVIATPHGVGWTPDVTESIIRAATGDCLRALKGEDPVYIKDPRVLPRWRERLARL